MNAAWVLGAGLAGLVAWAFWPERTTTAAGPDRKLYVRWALPGQREVRDGPFGQLQAYAKADELEAMGYQARVVPR